MTKDIWHTTKEKPMLHRDIILCGDGWSMPIDIIPETVNNICWKNVEKWCYVDDLIKENDHTRKALDVAVDALRHADWFFDGDYNVYTKDMHNEIRFAIKAIEQIKDNDKDVK